MNTDPGGANGPSDGGAVAAVVYEGPLGTEGLVLTDSMGPAVPFGRGKHCRIRFGYAPCADVRLPRQAGLLLVANGRLVVESSGAVHHPALVIRTPGRPPVEVSGGEAYTPAAIEFDVIARGEREWVINVRARRWRVATPDDAASAGDPSTYRPAFSLSAYERHLIEAYLAPLRAGRLEPATHAEVAAALHYSGTKVRVDLYAVWARMVAEGLAVQPWADKRLAVSRAALAYGLT